MTHKLVPFASSAALAGLVLVTACQAEDGSEEGSFDRSGLFVGEPAAQGKFATNIWDMRDGTSKITHHLVGDTLLDDVQIVLPPGVEIGRDSIVAAWGMLDDDGALVVDDYEILAFPPQHAIDPDARPARRIATVLVHYGNPTISNETAREKMFLDSSGAPDSTNYYYQQVSYGVEKLAGNVFGPYEIANPGGCSPNLVAMAAMDAFHEKGHTEENYIQFMFQFPQTSCDWSGLANMGSPDFPARNSWYNGSNAGFDCVTRAQELGHNYGLRHSNRYTCVDENGDPVLYSADCTSIEYGDPFDPMGGNFQGNDQACDHMSAPQKVKMGWLSGCNFVNATDAGTFNLLPLELPCNGTQLLQLPTFDGKFYHLEYRAAYGFDTDAGQQGVRILVGPEAQYVQNPNLIGGTVPANVFYNTGETYTDPGGSVSFTVLEEHDTHAVIQVTFPNGGNGNDPTCHNGGTPEMDSGAWGVIECAPLVEADVTPPTASITYPLQGEWIAPGSNFMITADAFDERGVTELELFVNGQPHPVIDIEEPWEWQVTNIPEGTYEIGARVWDGPNWSASDDNTPIIFHVGTPPPEEPMPTDDSSGGDIPEPMTDDGPVDPTGEDPQETDTDFGMNMNPESCACRSSDRTPPLSFGLFALGLVLARRRRRA